MSFIHGQSFHILCFAFSGPNPMHSNSYFRGQAGCGSVDKARSFQGKVYTHPFNGPFSGTTQVSRYQKGKTNLDFTEARDNEWQWHQLGHMQVCTSLQTDNHTSTPPLSFLQTGCPSCRPTNSVKALKASILKAKYTHMNLVVSKYESIMTLYWSKLLQSL